MQYLVLASVEKESSSGTKYKKATLKAEDGTEYQNVAVFTRYTAYSDVLEGKTVEGIIETKEDAKWGKSHTLTNGTPARTGGSRTAAMNQAMEKKQQGIAHAQENRELGVKIASTAGGATQIVVALVQRGFIGKTKSVELDSPFDDNDLQKEWNKWRAWLWQRWDDPKEPEWIENETIPFK